MHSKKFITLIEHGEILTMTAERTGKGHGGGGDESCDVWIDPIYSFGSSDSRATTVQYAGAPHQYPRLGALLRPYP